MAGGRAIATGRIPGLDKDVSKVVFGTLFLCSTEDPFELLDAVWRAGCNAFDCAKVYADGACERILGEWIAARKHPRDQMVIITKGGCHGQEKLWSANISREALRADLTASLRRLQVEHVDAFLLHRDDPEVPVATIVDTMHECQQEGLLTVWGVSNWDQSRLQAAIAYAAAAGKAGPVCDSLQFSLAQPSRSVWPDTKYLRPESRKWYEESGVAVLAWECLAKGFMAGKWSRDDIAQGDRARMSPENFAHLKPTGSTAAEWRELQLKAAYCTGDNFDRRERAECAAEDAGLSLAQVALKYVASQPFESFVLVGTSKVKHFEENARGLVGAPLDITQVTWLDEGRGASPWKNDDLAVAEKKARLTLD